MAPHRNGATSRVHPREVSLMFDLTSVPYHFVWVALLITPSSAPLSIGVRMTATPSHIKHPPFVFNLNAPFTRSHTHNRTHTTLPHPHTLLHTHTHIRTHIHTPTLTHTPTHARTQTCVLAGWSTPCCLWLHRGQSLMGLNIPRFDTDSERAWH
jgi:hypothetical protein